jgi:CxxC-x17-CxxC domain-containing protein
VRDFRPTPEQVKNYFSRPLASATESSREQRPRNTERRHGARGGQTRHQITCTGCGQQAEVPFQPDPTRPVYCSACFTPKRSGRR